jgi:hypothetical protein
MKKLNMKNTLFALVCALAITSFGSISMAAEIHQGNVVKVETRDVVLPIYTIWKENAVATLVLYSGGGGGYGKIGDDGWPSSANFLIRSAKLFAAHPFNIVLVGRATDVPTLDGATRVGENHDLDNQAIFRAIKLQSNAPIWLVGTSMGTISVTAAAIHDGGRNIAGIVLTSSVTAYRIKGAVPTQELSKIAIPVLVIHHEQDACKVCTPNEAKNIAEGLSHSPIKKTVLINGGTDPTGNPCEAMHYHGYIGIEKELVDLIATWVMRPSK